MITLNGLQVASVTSHIPSAGCWSVNVNLVPDQRTTPSIGDPATLVLSATQTLVGTVSDKQTFAGRAAVRVTGGYKWSRPVPRQDFENPNGTLYRMVLQATASNIQEPPPIELGGPEVLPSHYVRAAGPASTVFGRRPWFVGLDGVVRIGKRPTLTMPDDLVVSDYGMLSRILTVHSEGIIEPGTKITGENIDGALYVIESDQTFSSDGASGKLLVSSDPPSSGVIYGDAFVRGLAEMVLGVVRDELLKAQYMTVHAATPDGTLEMASDSSSPIPDVLPVEYLSAPGYRAEVTPGTKAFVQLDEKGIPRVTGFGPGAPLSIDMEALTSVAIKAIGSISLDALSIEAGAGGTSLVKVIGLVPILNAICTAIGTAGPGGAAAKATLQSALGITDGSPEASPTGLVFAASTLKLKGF